MSKLLADGVWQSGVEVTFFANIPKGTLVFTGVSLNSFWCLDHLLLKHHIITVKFFSWSLTTVQVGAEEQSLRVSGRTSAHGEQELQLPLYIFTLWQCLQCKHPNLPETETRRLSRGMRTLNLLPEHAVCPRAEQSTNPYTLVQPEPTHLIKIFGLSFQNYQGQNHKRKPLSYSGEALSQHKHAYHRSGLQPSLGNMQRYSENANISFFPLRQTLTPDWKTCSLLAMMEPAWSQRGPQYPSHY